MLIDLSRFGPLVIDPSQYLTTLAVRINVPDDKPNCGVFAGRLSQFTKEEEGNLVPCIENEDESPVFIIDRPKCLSASLMCRWSYVAIGWERAVYVEHPYVWTLDLQELAQEAGGPSRWHVSLSQNHGIRLTLILPEYKPGALARGYKAIK